MIRTSIILYVARVILICMAFSMPRAIYADDDGMRSIEVAVERLIESVEDRIEREGRAVFEERNKRKFFFFDELRNRAGQRMALEEKGRVIEKSIGEHVKKGIVNYYSSRRYAGSVFSSPDLLEGGALNAHFDTAVRIRSLQRDKSGAEKNRQNILKELERTQSIGSILNDERYRNRGDLPLDIERLSGKHINYIMLYLNKIDYAVDFYIDYDRGVQKQFLNIRVWTIRDIIDTPEPGSVARVELKDMLKPVIIFEDLEALMAEIEKAYGAICSYIDKSVIFASGKNREYGAFYREYYNERKNYARGLSRNGLLSHDERKQRLKGILHEMKEFVIDYSIEEDLGHMNARVKTPGKKERALIKTFLFTLGKSDRKSIVQFRSLPENMRSSGWAVRLKIGENEKTRLSDELKKGTSPLRVFLVGRGDRLGSAALNRTLAGERIKTVKKILKEALEGRGDTVGKMREIQFIEINKGKQEPMGRPDLMNRSVIVYIEEDR